MTFGRTFFLLLVVTDLGAVLYFAQKLWQLGDVRRILLASSRVRGFP